MRTTSGSLALAVALLASGTAASAGRDWEAERRELVARIERDVRETGAELGTSRLSPRVLAALLRVPRHEFVPEEVRSSAYANQPLPIGHGQTISQPYIVAIMTELLALRPGARVLEVGTGSGYQAAVLAEVAASVHSIEIVEPLGRRAREVLARQGYRNVEVRVGDGYYGWEEAGPFDGIMVTAAAGHVPPPLLRQLTPGGRMVLPLGSRLMTQQLVLVEKDAAGAVTTRQILPVRFVPLTGGH